MNVSTDPRFYFEVSFVENFDHGDGATIFSDGRFKVTRSARRVRNHLLNRDNIYVRDNYYSETVGDDRGRNLGFSMTHLQFSRRGLVEETIASVPLVGPAVSNLVQFWPALATCGIAMMSSIAPPAALGVWVVCQCSTEAVRFSYETWSLIQKKEFRNALTPEEQEHADRLTSYNEIIDWVELRE